MQAKFIILFGSRNTCLCHKKLNNKHQKIERFSYHNFHNRTLTVTYTVDSVTNALDGSKHRRLQQNNFSKILVRHKNEEEKLCILKCDLEYPCCKRRNGKGGRAWQLENRGR